MRIHIAAAVLSLAVVANAAVDKEQFTLANPTPKAAMREMSTDRPDTTESPYTVDAGHWQVEMSFFEYAGDGDSKEFDLAPFNLKVGLTNRIDLQVLLDPFVNFERPHASGVGDLTVRAKFNLWGNDGGQTAFALMPFITLPTSSGGVGLDDEPEFGLIAPFSIGLPNEWSLGLMAELDIVRDQEDDGYTWQLLHSVTLGHSIVGELEGYVELVGVVATDTGSGYQSYLDVGVTYGLSEDVQFDAGVAMGLSDSAEDFRVFTGISFRL